MARQGYGGLTAAQRRAQRRAQLLDAALEIVGTQGYDALTAAALRRATGLNDRYFYEHFQNRDDVLAALVDDLAEQTLAAMTTAVAAANGNNMREVVRAGLAAYIEFLTDDPRKARVAFLEAPTHEAHPQRRSVRDMFITLMHAQAQLRMNSKIDDQMRFAGIYLFGALVETTTSWTAGELTMTRDELIEYSTDLFVAVTTHVTGHDRATIA